MSLQILVSHTGERLRADPVSFGSLDAFRSWLAQASAIPSQRQILLTPRSKHVKLQTLLTEVSRGLLPASSRGALSGLGSADGQPQKEIFVYDRELFSPSTDKPDVDLRSASVPAAFTPDKPPDTLSDQNDFQAWQTLFRLRRDWAFAVAETARTAADTARTNFDAQDIIERSLRVASGNHESHVRGLERKLATARAWAEEVLREQEADVQSWDERLARLGSIPAREAFVSFLRPPHLTPRKESSKTNLTLKVFVDPEEVKGAATIGSTAMEQFQNQMTELSGMVDNVVADHNDLVGALGNSQSRSVADDREEPHRLLDEIEILKKKIASDYEHVLGLPSGAKSIAQVSKLALLHTRNYLPSLIEYSMEMGDVLRRSAEQRNNATGLAVDHMQTIAAIESTLSGVTLELDAVSIPSDATDAFNTLDLVSRLPYIYGALLIESARRHEWVQKMKKDSSTLAEELASYQEEEERRRKKWLKTMGETINLEAVKGSALGVEITLQAEEQSWPAVTRDELRDYVRTLRGISGLAATAETLSQGLRELDQPTRQQVKHAKTFKMGSVHEAGFGKGSLTLRGEDETRVLKGANAKLEEELKAQKSRVRKLEDLLHRQSQVSRVSAGSGFQPQGVASQEAVVPDHGNPPSPRPAGDLSRRSSISSRRFSSNHTQDEKALARRILKLEAELTSEKDAKSRLEKEALAGEAASKDVQRQMEEVNSTKKDLMENMEAQQKEFAEERRGLELELEKYKQKVEEVEDELDRILGSRDNEKTGNDNRLHLLESELVKTRRETADELQRAQDQIKHLEKIASERDQVVEERTSTLVAVYSHLSPNEEVPLDPKQFLPTLEQLAERTRHHVQDLSAAVAEVRSQNDLLSSSGENQKAEIHALTSTLDSRERELAQVRAEFDAEKQRANAIASELEEERHHLEELRGKFAEGETGSEALRQRVAEEEEKVFKLSTQLAATKSHVNSLDVELSSLQKAHERLQLSSDAASVRLQQRSQRARDLTQKLHAQNDRLLRLLETLGFAVTHQDDSMVVQRASKAGASTVLSEQTTGMNRSLSTPLPPKKPLEDSVDLSALFWMDKDNAEEEAETYAQYISTIDRFSLGAFSDAITKRMRDIEHTARKWQKEARMYRDKSHRIQGEAHEKIAYRGFKEGDLALFLPTRNQATRPWAAFNVGAPHYFLREQDAHKLVNKEYLVARISKIEERVVDLSKPIDGARLAEDRRSLGEASEGGLSYDDDNPFELSDGLRWYLLDAAEEKAGAPSTPGLAKTTVASAHVDARGSIRVKKPGSGNDASRTLNKSLDSRRSSTNSKKGGPHPAPAAGPSDPAQAADADAPRVASVGHSRLRPESQGLLSPGPASPGAESNLGSGSGQEGLGEVRNDLLWGP